MQPVKIKLKQQGHGTSQQRFTKGGLHQSSLAKSAAAITEREAQQYDHTQHEVTFKRNDREQVKFDQSQLDAIRTLLTQQYACISGPAGTGKTTIMAGALPFLEAEARKIDWGAARSAGNRPSGHKQPAIALCTFTNVAARNLASKIDEKWSQHCMSIHSMLCFAPIGNPEEAHAYNMQYKGKGMFEPRYHAGNKLPYDIIIIDEGGIVPKDLWHQLLDACEPSTRIYMLGDLFQLPAIQGVSPMPFAMHKWPTAFLQKIYRQADGSPIITQSHNIRRGVRPDHIAGKFLCGKNETLDQSSQKAQRHIAAYIQHLHKNGMFDPDQDIIITPQNGTSLGQEAWNSRFHFVFNPPRKDEATGKVLNPPILIKTAVGVTDLCVGDKIMATDNGGRLATEARLNNGSIAVITSIYPNPDYKGDMDGLGELDVGHAFDGDGDQFDMSAMWDATTEATNAFAEDAHDEDEEEGDRKSRNASHVVEVTEVATGDKYILKRSAEIANLRRAYAVTCHKFQGSQARRVIVIIHSAFSSNMLSREWLYTACTRAKEAVIILHDRDSMSKCLTRQEIIGRDATEKAKRLTDLYTKGRPWNVPELPEPESIPVDNATLQAVEALGA